MRHENILQGMEKLGIPVKIRTILKSMNDGYSCQVLHDGKLSEPFPANSGVTQGCILSPTLSVLVLDYFTTEGKDNNMEDDLNVRRP
jgi:hypothetical protein